MGRDAGASHLGILVGGALLACAFAACADGDAEGLGGGPGTDVGTTLDPRPDGAASNPRDGGGDTSDGPDKPGKDGSADAAAVDSGKDAATSGGLDPDLELPSGTTTCVTPGHSNECPLTTVCRIASPTGGICETCTSCGNLHATCATNLDCDILFQCYQGKCTNICPLGTTACGPVANCIDVGHVTHGVCKP